jgi:hypothetical protein
MNAREIFYAPAPPPAETKQTKATPAPSKASNTQKAATTTKAPPQAKASPAVPVVPEASRETSAQAATQTKTPDQQSRSTSAPNTVPVSLVTVARKPLGVRLSILKVAPSGQATEVPPDTSFQPGDRVRLNIQVSTGGYLFIINRGSSGTWTQLFPSPELPNASNAVVPGTTYAVPPDRNFVIGDPPGEEKLFVIVSRTPELDVQAMTMDLSRRGAAGPVPRSAPAAPESQPSARPQPEKTIAQNLPPIDDGMVDRLRTVYARDLIIEKVDEQTPGTRKENAVYAVNPGNGDDSVVVLDAQIKHR